MSAIWGKIQYTDEPDVKKLSMKSIYENRCKLDKIQEQTHQNQLFGCGIQYITSESKQELLPISSEDGTLLFTADCILDNRAELLSLLKLSDHHTPDGTIMYQAYLKWGIDCLSHFRGIFSLAVYDIQRKTLLLAADPVGSRCLYYHQTKDGCAFSTLLDSIINLAPDISHNELFIQDFLCSPGLRPTVSATETPYQDVYKIEAGTYVTLTPNGREITRYWRPTTLSQKPRSATQWKQQFVSLFRDCVHSAIRTNGEVGIALSSGLDSSSVAALAAIDLNQCSKPLHSYTYVPYYDQEENTFPDNFVLNEKEALAKTIARYPNIQPTYLNTHGADFYRSEPYMLSIMEIPFKAFINLPSLNEIFQSASNDHCKIVLTGQYGNATISYGHIDNILFEHYCHKNYISYLLTLNKYSKTVKESRKKAFKQCQNYFKRSKKIIKNGNQCYRPDNPYLKKEFVEQYPFKERFKNEAFPLSERCAISKKLYQSFLYNTYMLTYIGEYETKFGLAHGIVLRDPTRDPDILSFCHTMPYKYFVYDGIPRWLVREGLKEYLPHELLDSYFRYGLQNADWMCRIKHNWDSISKPLHSNLHASCIEKYIDASAVQSFFSENKDSFDESNYAESMYLFILDNLSQYLSRNANR